MGSIGSSTNTVQIPSGNTLMQEARSLKGEALNDVIDKAVKKYNEKLAGITTFSELQELRKEMDSEGLEFIMTTKIGGTENGIFKVDDVTVEYITTRTNKVYRSKIKNLHRVMQVHY